MIASVRGGGEKLFILWPRTSRNREIYSASSGDSIRFVTSVGRLEHPLLVLVSDGLSIYIPPGVLHAVLTLGSCMLPTINFINQASIEVIGDCAQLACSSGSVTMKEAEENSLNLFLETAKHILEQSTMSLYPLLRRATTATESTFKGLPDPSGERLSKLSVLQRTLKDLQDRKCVERVED